jgi:hypothetical protein
MKTLLLKLFVLLTVTGYSQVFQNNYFWNQSNFHDLNIEPIEDNSGDLMIAGNLFHPNMNSSRGVVMRVNSSGNTVWTNEVFASTGMQNLRIFDFELNANLAAFTGTVDDANGNKRSFIAVVDINTGVILANNYYQIVSSSFHNTSLHISYTESDVDADGMPDPGFIIGGFFSDSYAIDTSATNIGFVLRTDTNLNTLWTIEIDNSANGNYDYNMVNNVIETNDGFFITGSSTMPNGMQQLVLAHKIGFDGSFQWDSSYEYGNSRDVSVDAYFDNSTNKIYMLSNYSNMHHFGVTVFDNSTGTISVSQTWVATEQSGILDHYGFTIEESLSGNTNNLIITGYSREKSWIDANGNNITSQSNIFVYEFNKSTGTQVGHSNYYLVPHTEPAGDEYNFWGGQMPLIYYPEISTNFYNVAGVDYHYVIGYKIDTGSYTQANLFRTLPNFESICQFADLNFNPQSITSAGISVSSGFTPQQSFTMTLTYNDITPTVTNCTGEPLSINDNNDLKGSYLYPNPTENLVYITANNAVLYQVFDAQGRKISQGQISQDKSINIESLKNGLYFITILDNKNKSQIFKVIKK